ncbi:hypothetical protein [Sulfuricurvum sp.]|uniref:hypothetical protein n=1 Tax=Sulfuricurvum sp. TaxID=2025608 RepID=UPI003C5DB639
MKTLTLKIEDSAVEKVMWFLEQLKDVVTVEPLKTEEHLQKVDLENDPFAQELKRRIQEIDDGTMPLTPFKEGMDGMMERIRLKYASA